MKITAKVVAVLPKTEGEKDGKRWEKQQLIVEANDKKLAIMFFGEKRTAWLNGLKAGALVEVNFDVESHSYGERWFTELQGYGLRTYEVMKTGEEPQ